MGGGGVMRTAAKVAGIGVVNGGLRGGLSALPPAEHSLRKASVPAVSAMISSQSNGNGAAEVAAVQRPSWEIDDWVFAGGEEDMVLNPSEPMPRVVFGGPPTKQEAKEATVELKDALEKVYLSSPKAIGGLDSVGVSQVPCLSLLSNSEHGDTKSFVTYDPKASAAPNYAVKAITLLSESPAAQSVVASIASDPNVWNAVMQNESLTEFLALQRASVVNPKSKESDAEAEFSDQESSIKCRDSSEDCESGKKGGFQGFVENIKVRVVEMVNEVSRFIQDMFGSPAENSTNASASDGSAKSGYVDKTMAASFMGLAIMVIMVAVMKRA